MSKDNNIEKIFDNFRNLCDVERQQLREDLYFFQIFFLCPKATTTTTTTHTEIFFIPPSDVKGQQQRQRIFMTFNFPSYTRKQKIMREDLT